MPAVRSQAWKGVIAAYRDRLPVGADTPVITLHEGGTPLLPAPVLSARTGCEVYLKVEGANPTGSFKDRGMTVAISMAAGTGAQAVICASTGNTSASAAAYAARAGLLCAVLLSNGTIDNQTIELDGEDITALKPHRRSRRDALRPARPAAPPGGVVPGGPGGAAGPPGARALRPVAKSEIRTKTLHNEGKVFKRLPVALLAVLFLHAVVVVASGIEHHSQAVSIEIGRTTSRLRPSTL